MSAHRKWRIYITAQQNSTAVEIAEVEMRTSVSGSDVCSGGTAYADSYYNGYTPANAFDDDTGTFWMGNGTPPHYIEYDFGSGNEKAIVEVAITVRNSGYDANRAPKTFAVVYVENGINYPLWWVTNEAAWSAGEQRVYSMPTPGDYRFTQMAVEVLTSGPQTKRVTRLATETLVSDGTDLIITRMALEVLVTRLPINVLIGDGGVFKLPSAIWIGEGGVFKSVTGLPIGDGGVFKS